MACGQDRERYLSANAVSTVELGTIHSVCISSKYIQLLLLRVDVVGDHEIEAAAEEEEVSGMCNMLLSNVSSPGHVSCIEYFSPFNDFEAAADFAASAAGRWWWMEWNGLDAVLLYLGVPILSRACWGCLHSCCDKCNTVVVVRCRVKRH